MLDMVIHAVTQVIANGNSDPFGDVAVKQIQDCRTKPKREQKKRGADQVIRLAADQSVIDHRLNDPWHDQVESCERQKYHK